MWAMHVSYRKLLWAEARPIPPRRQAFLRGLLRVTHVSYQEQSRSSLLGQLSPRLLRAGIGGTAMLMVSS